VAAAVENKDWQEVSVILLSRFEVFLHLHRGGHFTDEESELFEALNVSLDT
jgi:hypothetical protein